MKPTPDDDLLAVFAQVRRCEREEAPAWRPELLESPTKRPTRVQRWLPTGLVAASVIALAAFLAHVPQHEPSLSEALPPLLNSVPGELFADVKPSLLAFEAPSDFLLTDHLNPIQP